MKYHFWITKLERYFALHPQTFKATFPFLSLGEAALSKTESPHPEFSGLLPPKRKSHKDSTGTAMHF